jgi:hypothetical protein
MEEQDGRTTADNDLCMAERDGREAKEAPEAVKERTISANTRVQTIGGPPAIPRAEF